MQFSRLRLNGFKSFVDPSELVIAPGLTGVVGPNGCGKSNLLEALRWVMGESRPTAMRGDGMEDVIFAGSGSRSARAQAEVVLTIDNRDRLAPAAFNQSDALEVARRIARDLGSSYRVNGKEVRARDVQMLFADASTGATSPALVRQGQISELINARPSQRRRILEDAAGIAGLTQRRHEVELKLNATQANLSRLGDVEAQLAQQLQSLSRQAKQAARYRDLAAALRRAEVLLLLGRWQEAAAALTAAEAGQRAALNRSGEAEAQARAAVAARAEGEAALPALREEAAIAQAVLERLGAQQEQLAAEAARVTALLSGIDGRLGQLGRDLEREAELNHDAAVSLARLEDEDARLVTAAVDEAALLSAAGAAVAEAAVMLEEAEARQAEAGEAAAEAVARHQASARALEALRTKADRTGREHDAAVAAAEAAAVARDAAMAAMTAAEVLCEEAVAIAEAAEERCEASEAMRAAAEAREAEARAARSRAEGEARALGSAAEALARLLAQEATAGVQILDRLRVAPGYERALGAALGDDLRAPERGAGEAAGGWHLLPPLDETLPLPDGATPLSAQVAAPAALARRLALVGVVTAADGARLQARLRPGQRLVSPEGDLWRWDGFRALAAETPSAAALRLEQRNRLEAIQADHAAAEEQAEAAADLHEAALDAARAAARQDQAARDARREADRRAGEADRASARAAAEQTLAESRLQAGGQAAARLAEELSALAHEVAVTSSRHAELPDPGEVRERAEAARKGAEAARRQMLAARDQEAGLRREAEARAARRKAIAREAEGWRARLAQAGERSQELERRRAGALAEQAEARGLPAALEARRSALADSLAAAADRQRRAGAALSAAEASLSDIREAERQAERLASSEREARAGAEARLEAARAAFEEADQRFREAGQDPQAFAGQPGAEALPPAAALEAEIARLVRQREAMGAVNLRAEEDAREVEAELSTLLTEKADLEEALKKLRAGIGSLNREGRERLLAAFEEVNANFRLLFTHLFGGGEARLTLVESDDPLEAGLEILCQPPGKKLATLSLLSGGEQTLTALALIFAVFLSRPSPVCVLDEVDAPLDDANVTRFCDLLDEMGRRTGTRFLVITHHAVTMARMHRLFGVTMQEQGVSQIVSVDLSAAAALVA